MHRVSRVAAGLAATVLLFVTGCGGGGARLHPVKGKVTVGNSPMTVAADETAVVEFWPDKAAGNTSTGFSRADVGPAGEYELKTDNKPGAPAGAYVVVVRYDKGPPPGTKDKDMYAV